MVQVIGNAGTGYAGGCEPVLDLPRPPARPAPHRPWCGAAMTRAGRCPIGPECKWAELGEGWQECNTCGIERRDPRLADRAAMESGRKVATEPIQPAVRDLGRKWHVGSLMGNGARKWAETRTSHE